MSSMLPPASSTADFKFSQTCRVCASMSPMPAIVPSGRRAVIPEMKTMRPRASTMVAWEKWPDGWRIFDDMICCLGIRLLLMCERRRRSAGRVCGASRCARASISMRMSRVYCRSPRRKLQIKSQPISENIAIGSRFDMASKAIFEFRPVEGRLLELLLRLRERLHFEHHEGVAGHVRGHHGREVAFERLERAELEHALEAHGTRDCRVVVAADIRQHCIGGRAIDPVRDQEVGQIRQVHLPLDH